jgi:1-acyl-sn-glycerol-3-phosphate acyltransferase
VSDLREGAAYLALRAGVPIIPVGLAGTERAMPKGARLFRPGRVTLVVGDPITPPLRSTADGAGSTKAARVSRSANRTLTEELRMGMETALSDALALDKLRGGARLASSADNPEVESPLAARTEDQDEES